MVRKDFLNGTPMAIRIMWRIRNGSPICRSTKTGSHSVKHIYIAGLEHSGTTLLSQLLGGLPECLALGEVAMFLSPTHMQTHKTRWGRSEDYGLCSCGSEWKSCKFWGPRYHLCGLESDDPLPRKYGQFLRSLPNSGPDAVIPVDSSKSLVHLHTLQEARKQQARDESELMILLVVKDPRGFLSSMKSKAARSGAAVNLVSLLRTLNHWCGANRAFLKEISLNDTRTRSLITYETLCLYTDASIRGVRMRLGLDPHQAPVSVNHSHSHIAMGNKDFLNRNRHTVQYDSRWFYDSAVQWAYLLHPTAKALNKQFQTMDTLKDTQ